MSAFHPFRPQATYCGPSASSSSSYDMKQVRSATDRRLDIAARLLCLTASILLLTNVITDGGQ